MPFFIVVKAAISENTIYITDHKSDGFETMTD